MGASLPVGDYCPSRSRVFILGFLELLLFQLHPHFQVIMNCHLLRGAPLAPRRVCGHFLLSNVSAG